MKKSILLILATLVVSTARAYDFELSWTDPDPLTLYFNIISTTDRTVEVTYPGTSASNAYPGTQPTGEIEIPSCVRNPDDNLLYTITAIGDNAFKSCSGLTSVWLPNTVTSIGNYAFRYCTGLNTVVLPNGLTSIGALAFASCTSLESISIPNSVTSIGQEAFTLCKSIRKLIVPSTVNSIGAAAFTGVHFVNYCGTATGNSPWGADVFASSCCIEGNYVYSDETKETLLAYTGNNVVDPNYTLTIPNTVITIGNKAFMYWKGARAIVIPNSVTSIGTAAFYNCSNLTSISISNSLTSIGNSAFWQCSNLNNITIPNSVTEIEEYAFYNCTSLVNIVIPNNLSSIKNNVFASCTGLTSVAIPNSVTSIGESAFENCTGLTSVIIPNSVTSIGGGAFGSCTGLTSVNIGNSVSNIGSSAFSYCSRLTNIVIPNSVTDIESMAFYHCGGLTNISIGDSVTNIGANAFGYCSGLKSIIIPNRVTSIGSNTFYQCSSLTIFDLTDISNFTRTSRGTVKRVVKCTNYGTGVNAIHQIPTGDNGYTVVTSDANNMEKEIPYSLIPDNFIYSNDNGTSWQAKNVVLTDCQDAFNTPVEFTADNVTYTRELTDQNRSTLCLPFSRSIPTDLQVYQFGSFDGSTIHFTQVQNTIAAYTPYLVGKGISSKAKTTFIFSKENAVFPATPASIATDPISNLTFHGAMQRTCMSTTNYYGYKDGYFVQSGGLAAETAHAHVNPFRCYFVLAISDQNPPASMDVVTDDGRLGIDDVDASDQNHIRYSNDVYDMMGRLVRKNAENLHGLPRGIYIWRGKKEIAY